jgi:hypothetical protein
MDDRAAGLTTIAVVLGIAAAVILVWVAMPRSSGVDCNPSHSGQTPLGSFLSLSPPREAVIGPTHWYNFSLQSVPGDLRLANLVFEVQTTSGVVVQPNPAWTLRLTDPAAGVLGNYSLTGLSAGTWASGGATTPISGDTVGLLTTPGGVNGDWFDVFLTGTYASGCPATGSISVSIP